MRILGIDPGSVATGWGVVASDRASASLEHVAHGTLRPPKAASLPARLAHIHRGLVEVIERFKPEAFAIEKVFLARNPHSALVLGQARGAAMAALGVWALDGEEVAAREVKQSVVGSGAAAKSQIQRVVANLLGLENEPREVRAVREDPERLGRQRRVRSADQVGKRGGRRDVDRRGAHRADTEQSA